MRNNTYKVSSGVLTEITYISIYKEKEDIKLVNEYNCIHNF